MDSCLGLRIGDRISDIVSAVVEIPFDSATQFEFAKASHAFRRDRTPSSPVHNPVDYDFIPHTQSEYGDLGHLQILDYTPTFLGCLPLNVGIGMEDTPTQLRQGQRGILQRFGMAQ
jgi:inorganic pyrophosphatase